MYLSRRYSHPDLLRKLFILSVMALCLGVAYVPGVMAQEEELQATVDGPIIWDTLTRQQKVKLISTTIRKFRMNKGVTIFIVFLRRRDHLDPLDLIMRK